MEIWRKMKIKCSNETGLVKAMAIQVRSNEPQAIPLLNATFFPSDKIFSAHPASILLKLSGCIQCAVCTVYASRYFASPGKSDFANTHNPSPRFQLKSLQVEPQTAQREHTYVQPYPRSAAPFLPLDFSDSRLAELKRFVGLINLARRYVEGVWSLFDRQLGFSSILSPTRAPRSYLTRSDVMSQQGAIFINLQLRYDLNVPALQLVDCDWLMKSVVFFLSPFLLQGLR